MRQILLSIAIFAISGCATFSNESREKAELHLQIGTSHYEQGNYAFALKELLEGEKLDPQNPLIQNNIGLTYFMREKYDLAEKSLRKAVALKPDMAKAWLALADHLRAVGDGDGADAAYLAYVRHSARDRSLR